MLFRSVAVIACSLLVIGCLPRGAEAQPAVVSGEVRTVDETGIPYANVRLKGTTTGTATNATGQFRFHTQRTGTFDLRASAVGYETAEQRLDLAPGDTASVTLVLSPTSVQLEETIVAADVYSTGSASHTTLSSTEAVTTPGANGDLFRALQSFPGVASPGDGAGLFVRGGDVSETKTLLDQATLHHPYRYESPTGGSFGAVRPFLLQGTQFSTGGFSAQYGNALSGVLAMESKDRPQSAQQYVNLGLAAASVSIDQPLIENELGLRLSGNRSFTGVLFRMNDQRDNYATVPQGLNGSLSLTWDYSDVGQLKLFSFARHNRIGIETTEGTVTGTYRGRSTNQLHNLQWTTAIGEWMVESSASWSAYHSKKRFNILDLSPVDQAAKARVDATRSGSHWTLRTGGTVERRRYQFTGTLPRQPDLYGQAAPRYTVENSFSATRTGVYVDAESRALSPLIARAGIRTDHSTRGGAVVDPRLSLAWRLSPHTQLRGAWGLYHQFPELSTYSKHTGTNPLGPQRAEHYVVGLHHERGELLLRAQAYHKPYDDLVVRTGPATFDNTGSGFAQGVDLFAKYGTFLETRVNGWLSYSLLQSERTQPRDRGSGVQLERGPAPYDLTHQATVVGKVRVIDQFRLGGTYRYTTGSPFTPVAETMDGPSGAVVPVDGPVGSKRLPAYHRLDLQLSYYLPFNRRQHIIFYAAVNNALDHQNVVDVTYSPTYEDRRWRTTDYVRSVYVGLTLTL